MKLHSLTGASGTITHGEDTYEIDETGCVEIPHELGERLRGTHIDGVKVWEDATEQHERETAEDLAARRDPAATLAELRALREEVSALREELAAATVEDEPNADKPSAGKKSD